MTEADRARFLDLEASGGDMQSLRMSDESIDAMNRGLADNINARVGPDDTLWCLGDWAFGRGGDYLKNARWFRDRIACRTVHLIWGNHDDRKIRDLFSSTHEQAEVRDGGGRLTLNHDPMLTWNGQHHATVAEPNIHLYGHVHALYQGRPNSSPLKDADAWPALDVGFDGHDYHVWSLGEILGNPSPEAGGVRGVEAAEAAVRPVPWAGAPGCGGPTVLHARRAEPRRSRGAAIPRRVNVTRLHAGDGDVAEGTPS